MKYIVDLTAIRLSFSKAIQPEEIACPLAKYERNFRRHRLTHAKLHALIKKTNQLNQVSGEFPKAEPYLLLNFGKAWVLFIAAIIRATYS